MITLFYFQSIFRYVFIRFYLIKINPKNISSNETIEEVIEELYESGTLARNFSRPVIKDSIGFPSNGYAIVRFIADNPGFWALHCHVDLHSDLGMMMILKVGESDQLPSRPKDWPFFPLLPPLSQHSSKHLANKYLSLVFIAFNLQILKFFDI